jgi:hypothetical protein
MYYHCVECNYDCVNRRTFDSHINSKKHIKNVLVTRGLEQKVTYTCNQCNNVYSHYSSLARHKTTCFANLVNTEIDKIPIHIQEEIAKRWIARQNVPSSPNYSYTPKGCDNGTNVVALECTINRHPTVPTPASQVVLTSVPTRQVNAFGNENYDCVTFGGNFEILRRPIDAFEYMLDELYEDPANINIIFEDKRNYLLKYIKPDKTTEVLSLATLIKKALDKNKQKFLDYCIQHMDIVNPGSRAQDIRNYTVTEHGLYNSVTGTTELIHNNTLRDIMPDFMSNTCMNHYNRDFKELLKVKFLEIAHSSNAKLNFSGL